MLKKIVKILTNNLGLKTAAIVAAVILWLIVVNYDNPEMTSTFQVPVTILNENVLEDMGKVYEVVGASDIATIYVTGKRSYIDALNSSDFTATADLSQADFQSESEQKFVHIDVSAKKFDKHLSISQKTVNLQITIEDLASSQKYISCETQGTPADGYAIGDMRVTPNLIKISGPQSVVDRVSRVVARVNVEGLTGDISDSVMPVLYDEKGNVIESPQLKLNQTMVLVNVDILATKIVPVRCEVSGTPVDGYEFIELEYAPDTLLIKGEAETLNGIHEIVIPKEAINIDGASGDGEYSIDVTPYLEELGVSLVEPEENKIGVKAIVKEMETKTLELSADAIKQENLEDGFEAEFIDSRVNIVVRGRMDDLDQLNVGQLTATVNLRNLTEGTHTVPVEITIDEKYTVVGIVTVQVEIKEIVEDTGTGSGSGENPDGSGTGEDQAGTDNNQAGNDNNQSGDDSIPAGAPSHGGAGNGSGNTGNGDENNE